MTPLCRWHTDINLWQVRDTGAKICKRGSYLTLAAHLTVNKARARNHSPLSCLPYVSRPTYLKPSSSLSSHSFLSSPIHLERFPPPYSLSHLRGHISKSLNYILSLLSIIHDDILVHETPYAGSTIHRLKSSSEEHSLLNNITSIRHHIFSLKVSLPLCTSSSSYAQVDLQSVVSDRAETSYLHILGLIPLIITSTLLLITLTLASHITTCLPSYAFNQPQESLSLFSPRLSILTFSVYRVHCLPDQPAISTYQTKRKVSSGCLSFNSNTHSLLFSHLGNETSSNTSNSRCLAGDKLKTSGALVLRISLPVGITLSPRRNQAT
jgi:hypothetical protein